MTGVQFKLGHYPSPRIGLEPGDVVKRINRLSVKDLEEFNRAMIRARKNNTVLLLVQRDLNGYYVTLEPQEGTDEYRRRSKQNRKAPR